MVKAYLDTHNGYEKWHREYDARVVDWLENPQATREEFVSYINKIYQEAGLKDRIPM